MTKSDWLALRAKHPQFHYHQASYQVTPAGLEVAFHFSIEPGLTFKPQLVFQGVTAADVQRLAPQWLQKAVFCLGLVEMISYWKAATPPQIVVSAGYLDPEEVAWWQNLLIQGLGEFFFINQIDFTPEDFVTWDIQAPATSTPADAPELVAVPQVPKILIPVGGGKDSVVSLEVMKAFATSATQLATFHIHPTLAALDTQRQSGITRSITVQRRMDPLLLELNQAGYLNGHTPFSSLAAFTSLLGAALFEYDWIALSNERSSNEGNVVYLNHEINHQYSKTFEFESSFREYYHHHLHPWWTGSRPHPEYFSLLRPLYELQIAQLFSTYPGYFPLFRSCNVGRQTNSWCGRCPKCLFAYSIIAPFLPEETMVRIFGHNLLADSQLLPLALQLAGKADQKPFECVGTHEETLVAWYLVAEHYRHQQIPLPALLAELDTQILSRETDLANRATILKQSWNENHALPRIVADHLKAQLVAAQHLIESRPS